MKKLSQIAFSLVLASAVMLSNTVTSFAAGGRVIYDGKTEKITVVPGGAGDEYSKTDIFGEEFKNVMPGDERTTTVKFVNNSKDKHFLKVYIKAVAPADVEDGKVLGTNEDGDAFTEKEVFQAMLDQIELTIKDAKGKAFMSGKASELKYAAGEDGHFVELHNGDDMDFDVTIKLPLEFKAPENIEKGTVAFDDFQNSFADKIGLLRWVIEVEEIHEPIPPTPPVPDTGDTTNTGLYVGIAVGSVVVLAVLFIVKKKNQK